MSSRGRRRRRRGTKFRARNRNAELLLAVSTVMIGFDGDFVDLAAHMGWTTGVFWRENVAIRIAEQRYEDRYA
jgi:hypothetical protein